MYLIIPVKNPLETVRQSCHLNYIKKMIKYRIENLIYCETA